MSCTWDDMAVKCENCHCDKPRIIAVIPCFGRFSLLRFNVNRLYSVNGIYKVILVGHEQEVQKIADETNSIFVHQENKPLGLKWQVGFKEAKKLNPHAVLFVGSSDLISKDWLKESYKYLKDFDMVGKLGCHFMDINTQSGKRLVFWPGYKVGVRSKETIGIGRLISARILDKMNWEPFDVNKNYSMDGQMQAQVLRHEGKIKIMEDDVQAISISTNLWTNLHQFEQHWNNLLPSEKIIGEQMTNFLETYFPDIKNLNIQ